MHSNNPLKSNLLALALLSCLSSPVLAADSIDKKAQDWINNFKKADANYDGALSKAEVDKTPAEQFRLLRAQFDRMDTNRNSAITPQEYADFVQKRRDAWIARFKTVDLNSSQGLSKTELDKTKPTEFKQIKTHFDAMDSNRDGQVTVVERDNFSPTKPVDTKPAFDLSAAFKKADLNDSGGLSKTETASLTDLSFNELKQNFDRIDSNRDGQVSLAEYQNHLTEGDEDSDESSLLSTVMKLFK